MSVELNPATRAAPVALPLADPAAAGRAPGPGQTLPFASDLAQWMAGRGEVTVPSSAESALEDAIEPEPEAPATDPVAMFWLALGLPAPVPVRKAAATAATDATAAPGQAAEDGDSSQGLPALLAGSLAEPPARGSRAIHPGPVMPSLPAAAAETARSALAAAFAQHLERFAAEPARGAAPPGVETLVPAPRAPDAPPPVGVPVIERLAAMVATITPAAVIDPRLPQAPQQIAETVIWNLGKGVQEVRIHLNPEDLGPLDLDIRLDGDRVAVRFDLPDASLRDVVQSSLPNLAALLGARGLALDQAQVFTQQGRGQAHPPAPQSQANEDAPVEPVQAPRAGLRRGLVDDYV